MKLLTKELLKKIPPLYSQENVDDPMVVCKFFTPWTNWTWYVIEYEDGMFFGLVEGFEKELGYFTLEELEDIKGPFGLKIERDMHFTPVKISTLRGR